MRAIIASIVVVAGWSVACCLPAPTPEQLAEFERRDQERAAERQRAAEELAAAEKAKWDALPETERKFCEVLSTHKEMYEAAENDLKRSAVRTTRGKALLAAVPGGKVKGWSATVKNLTTTSQGNAILEMKLPCDDFGIGTWNNELSDIMDNTLIPRGSDAFATLAELSPGAQLTFSGTLVRGDHDGFREGSMTEIGSMTGGYFIFRF